MDPDTIGSRWWSLRLAFGFAWQYRAPLAFWPVYVEARSRFAPERWRRRVEWLRRQRST